VCHVAQPALQPTVLSPEEKRPGLEADHSPLPSANMENGGSAILLHGAVPNFASQEATSPKTHFIPNVTLHLLNINNDNNNSVALVRERTISTERPLLVGEISAIFLQVEGATLSA
jgi:hypothetical protein